MTIHSDLTATTPADPVPVPFVIERICADPDGKALALVNIRFGPIRLDGCKLVRIEGRRARLYLPSTRRGDVNWCCTRTRTAATLAALSAAVDEGIIPADHPVFTENFIPADHVMPTRQTVAREVDHAA